MAGAAIQRGGGRRCLFSTVVDLVHLTSPIAQSAMSALPSLPLPDLLSSYTVTPPVQPWPRRLTHSSLIYLLRTHRHSPSTSFNIFRYALLFSAPFSPSYSAYRHLVDYLSYSHSHLHLIPSVLSWLLSSHVRAGEDIFITSIRIFGRARCPGLSYKVFLSIPHYNIQPSVRSLNALLNALIDNCRFRAAYVIFRRARSAFNIIPNVCSCNILLKMLCSAGDLESALSMLEEMPEWGVLPNVVSYTTLLVRYCALQDFHGAEEVFRWISEKGLRPDVTTYTVLIDGYCRAGRVDDAARVMDKMEREGVRPNEVSYSVIIEACCKENRAGEALGLVREMLGTEFMLSSSLCCKVIDCLCKAGKVQEALELWRKLLKKNMVPDNAVSSALIYWLCKKGEFQEARKLFDEFERGYIPSTLTYNTLISGLCENGELQEAARLWDDMVEKGCLPNVVTYAVLIEWFSKAGKAKEAVSMFDEMLSKGFSPGKTTYKILLDGILESGDGNTLHGIVQSIAFSRPDLLCLKSWEVFVKKVLDKDVTLGHQLDAVLQQLPT